MNPLALPAPEALTASQGLAEQARSYSEHALEQANALTVTTGADADRAIAWARQLREVRKRIEQERDALAKPLRELAAAISKRWKPAIDMYEAAERALRAAITTFEDTKAQAAQAALEGAVDREQIDAAVAIIAPVTQGAYQSTRWHAEVTDLPALLRYAAEHEPGLVEPRMGELNKRARSEHEALQIPGVRAVCVRDTVVRS